VALSFSTAADAKVRSGDRAAELGATKSASGKKMKLKHYRGKVVVLTFGASWCKPCGRELPAYEKLSKKYSKKDVVFIAVNIDSSKATGKKFVRKAGLKNVVVGFDPNKSSVDTWDPPTMPSTFVIDRKGIVRKVHKGYEPGDEKDIAAAIAKLK
jgi:peroxiredoxin